MANETSDFGHHKQILIVTRYFDDEINRSVETFVAIKRMTSVTIKYIFNMLRNFLILILKNWDSMIVVFFDGISTMWGNLNDVQNKYKEQNNEIMYVY